MWIYSHATMSTKTYLKSAMILLSTSPVKSMIKWRPIAWGWRYAYPSGNGILDYNGLFLSFARRWFQWHCNTLTLWIIINKTEINTTLFYERVCIFFLLQRTYKVSRRSSRCILLALRWRIDTWWFGSIYGIIKNVRNYGQNLRTREIWTQTKIFFFSSD